MVIFSCPNRAEDGCVRVGLLVTELLKAGRKHRRAFKLRAWIYTQFLLSLALIFFQNGFGLLFQRNYNNDDNNNASRYVS